MISKNTIKRLNSLSQKKYRNKERLFLVEGDKVVQELIYSNTEIETVYLTNVLFETISKIIPDKAVLVSKKEIKKISQQKTPQNSIAVCRIPDKKDLPKKLNESLSIYLDGVQDPGNLGTIIRLCDWFGIKYLFCSEDTVDLYNPKVIQASMGSFTRVELIECNFEALKELAKQSETHIYGTFMDGESIYSEKLSSKSLLVMGNEGSGISDQVKALIDTKISIPNFSNKKLKAESLNVSVATAICCSEFKRR